MIVKMKKVTLLVSQKRTNIAVNELRKLGVLHIKHMRSPHADYITAIEHKLTRINNALDIVNDFEIEEEPIEESVNPWKEISKKVKEVGCLGQEKEKLQKIIEQAQKEQIWFKDWGNVSKSMIESLKEKGVFVNFHICSKSFLKTIDKEEVVYVLKKRAGLCYIVHISRNKDDSLKLPKVEAPQESSYALNKKITLSSQKLEEIDAQLKELSIHKKCFLHYKEKFIKKLEFCQVRFGMISQEGVACLGGFCPEESVSKISKAASINGWATIFEEPDNPDEVPTLIRNPRWVEIIKPVFKFMGTLPGYKEFDISFWFLLFFSLFFAMLIGDGGYGLVLLATTVFLKKKFKTAQKEIFFLMYVLSAATVIWGAITGTWFGFENIAKLPILNSLVIDKINSFVSANQLYMIFLCFVIGAVHLTIAHAIMAFRYINSVVALAQAGWICIIWSAFFLAGNLLLSKPLPGFIGILGVGGALLVILFSNPQKNIIKGMAISLADLPLKAISSFSDIVSYLRLFAVGYATVAVASTFNAMAFEAGFNNIIAGIIAALILFFGHTLNILLGLMAVVVHGIRLNMLEFSGHLNMQWSGSKYRPFK